MIREQLRLQMELEDECRALGAARYRNRQLPWKDSAGAGDEEANLPPGQQLLKIATIPTAKAFEAFLEEACSGKAGRRHDAADILLLIDPLEAAYLTLRVAANCGIASSFLQQMAIKVADALLDNLQFHAFKQQNKYGYHGYMQKQTQRSYSRQRRAAVKKMFAAAGVARELGAREKTNIGKKCLEMMCEATGLFTLDTIRKPKGMAYTIRPTETLVDWLEKQHARCEILAPLNMPMIVRPRRWRSPTHGGYITHRPGNRLVKQRNPAYHLELRNVEMPDVYESINHIQETPWRINTKIMDVLQAVWESGGHLGGLPPREDLPLPPKPHDIDENDEAKKAWKRAAADTYETNANYQSARLAVQQGLWVARKFAGQSEMFYPHELDFRGRVYPSAVFGPGPQGCDWQKGLIEFAHGMPVGEEGRRWLLIHIANLFGVDKVPFDDRIEWTLSHAKQLIDSAENPLDGERFWTKADAPYCALAACFEFVGLLDQGVNFISHLPVALDGSCSGLQHFSAMLRDVEGATAVNLVPSEKPQDVYAKAAAKAQAVADATPEITYTITSKGETQEVTIANPWMNGKITRSIAKRPTMTFTYSATRFGMQKMIQSTLREMDREREEDGMGPYLGGADNYHASIWLSHVLFSSISQTVTAAAVAMDWLREVAKVAASGGLPLWWTTPMGMPILQEYKVPKGVRVDTHWGGQRLQMMLQVDTEVICAKSQSNAVAPNFVHSLDAAHLQAVALRAKREGIQYLAVIHDSFGTHAANTGQLSRILRETFVEQYSDDILGNFYEQMKEQLGEELAAKLPEPPKAGELDLSQILKSAYMFA
ncbi:MAG: DNA-directed RNA polymerase [Chakrabartia sp.]